MEQGVEALRSQINPRDDPSTFTDRVDMCSPSPQWEVT